MNPQRTENWKGVALAFFVAAPMSYIVQLAMGIPLSALWTLAFAAVFLLILEGIGYNRVTAITIPSVIVVLAACIWWAMDKDQRQVFIDYYWWAMGFLYSWSEYPVGNVIVLTAITTFLTTLIVWLFGKKVFCFPVVFVFVVAVIVIKWLNGLDNVLLPGLLACGGIILLWAKSTQRRTARKAGVKSQANGIALYLAPVTAAIVLLSYVFLPADTAQQWQSRQVYDLFERVNNYLADYTHFDRPRSTFSIATYGFMPMGNRLGGAVNLSDDEVLHVQAPRRMLLRGIVYNNYTGQSWTDTTNSARIKFGGANREAAENAFDAARPQLSGADAAEFSSYLEDVTLVFHPIVNSSSTLFAPSRGVYRVTSNKFLAVLPYFNAKGEVFSSSDVHAGYDYTVSARTLRYDESGFDALMNRLMGMGLTDSAEQSETIRQNYLTLPEGIYKAVYDIVDGIDKGFYQVTETDKDGNTITKSVKQATPENDWQKALAIKEYLLKNFEYTLTPDTPMKNVDFVSYFIKYDKKGYCTYFASAMAVMARIAGIPSRYVEGYMLPEKGQDEAEYVVRGKNAHAWAELYFKGIGWVPFDATPSGENTDTSAGTGDGDYNPLPTPPRPETDDTGDSAPVDLPEKGLTWQDILSLWWVVPALLLAWVFVMMARARVRALPAVVCRRVKDANRRCAWYYGEVLKLLRYYNYPVKQGETPIAYGQRIDRWLRVESGTFGDVARLITMISYSDYTASQQDFLFLAQFRRQLANYTYHTVGPWYYLWHHVLGFRIRQNATPPDR